MAGLPFYGRMWKLDGPTTEGVTIAGKGLSSTRVDPLVDKFNGKITFDEKTQSTNATFTIPKGQSAFLGTTKLTEGNYVIWYDNEPAIRAKLQLPKQYGIKGTGSWALYHETPDTWDYYTAALNWEDVKKVVTRFGSGPMGVTTTDVNFRGSPSTSGNLKGSLIRNTPLKITGEPVPADNYQWFPIKLMDGAEGFVAGNYLKKFYLNELYGKSRYDTSTLVSSEGWKEKSEAVVLGRGDLPIDALTGSVLATKFQSPLLLTSSKSLPDNVVEEIGRLTPSTVYLLGGEQAISGTIESTLKQMGYTVKRIAGKSRYDTSIQVANEVGVQNEMFLTTGKDSPDALSVAPYAGMSQIPILLTKQDSLPDEIKTFISERGIAKVTIIGGTGAVSEGIINELKDLGVQDIERVSGKSRYDTSVAIATRYKSELDLSSLYFASGVSYIDALPGSPLAAKNGAPILLVGSGDLPESVTGFLQNELPATPNVNIIGGYGVISDTTRANLFRVIK
nr:cell wall-binding repeat-containing protein [Bacillus timonensis]